MATREEAIAEYGQALVDLHEFSKSQIKFLTMLAKDHVQYAPEIVSVIEAHIQKVKPNEKLPAIYLIDSIVKDLPQSSYKSLLMKNIVHTFTSGFEKVDKKTRLALFKVRQSWVGVFPNNKLYSLDRQINNRLDPAWPITATPPVQGSSHVDPRFLQSRQQCGRLVKRDDTDDTRCKRPKLEGCNSGPNLLHDMSDLVGRFNQDHRSGHTSFSNTYVDQQASIQFQSSSNKGWHNFKKSHSEVYGMPQTTNTTGPDVDIFILFSKLKEVGMIPSTSSQESSKMVAKMKEEPSLEKENVLDVPDITDMDPAKLNKYHEGALLCIKKQSNCMSKKILKTRQNWHMEFQKWCQLEEENTQETDTFTRVKRKRQMDGLKIDAKSGSI